MGVDTLSTDSGVLVVYEVEDTAPVLSVFVASVSVEAV